MDNSREYGFEGDYEDYELANGETSRMSKQRKKEDYWKRK